MKKNLYKNGYHKMIFYGSVHAENKQCAVQGWVC
jgi:hypothetical protein